jgi:hypothetical protein
MALRVEKKEWLESKSDWEKLLKYARDSKMNANTIMFVRTASDKITNTLTEFEKIKKEKAAEKEKAQQKAAGPAPPSVFTVVAGYTPDFNTQIGVKVS